MKAAIDIGTNTVLLLIAEVADGHINVIEEQQRLPRLGKGVDEDRVLHYENMQRVFQVLKEYETIISTYPEVDETIVTATSAVRDAQNRKDFLDQIKKDLGFEVRLLSGLEEAQWTYTGALSVLDDDDARDFMVLDIGGGSTEVAFGTRNAVKNFFSFDMGCVRFRERFLTHNPPFQEEIFQCREEIEYLFSTKRFRLPKKLRAVGVAGTATSLAAIDLQLDEFENDRLNGHVIQKDKLSKSIDIFSLHTYDQLLELSPKLLAGREDIFLAGLLILEGFMKHYNVDEVVVSTGGIRHGAILQSKKD